MATFPEMLLVPLSVTGTGADGGFVTVTFIPGLGPAAVAAPVVPRIAAIARSSTQ
jgi:hypothetical protein